jgi:hypothetical protein
MLTYKNLFTGIAASALMLFFISFFYQGCTDDTVSAPPVYDTSKVNFNGLIISERTAPFDSAYSSVDLYHGAVVQEQSITKDAVLVDSAQMSANFYFRSGNLSIDMAPGYQTKFNQVFLYPNLTKTQWDTLSRIPGLDSNLKSADFTAGETPYFRDPLEAHTIFGFCLLGRYPLFSTNMAFGMIYIDSTWRENGVFKVKINIKINKNGKNSFAVNTSGTF